MTSLVELLSLLKLAVRRPGHSAKMRQQGILHPVAEAGGAGVSNEEARGILADGSWCTATVHVGISKAGRENCGGRNSQGAGGTADRHGVPFGFAQGRLSTPFG